MDAEFSPGRGGAIIARVARLVRRSAAKVDATLIENIITRFGLDTNAGLWYNISDN
jgi:hypothetical protein